MVIMLTHIKKIITLNRNSDMEYKGHHVTFYHQFGLRVFSSRYIKSDADIYTENH